MGEGQQLRGHLGRGNLGGSCIEPAINHFGTAECQLHLLEEVVKIHFWFLGQLARKTHSQTKNDLGG